MADAGDPDMIKRAMNGKLKTLQEVLVRAVGPAAADALQRVAHAPRRDNFLSGERRTLEKALHRVCGAPAADERLSLPPAGRSRAATVW
jgi:hypothetical protein